MGLLAQQQTVSNTATATYQTLIGTDSAASNTVQTALIKPAIALQNTLLSPTTAVARIGDTVRYRVSYSNPSVSVAAHAAMLTDTLPLSLEFVAADANPVVIGHVIHWTLGDLAPGSTGDIIVTLVASSAVRDTIRVKHAITLTSLNADPQSAVAAEVLLIGAASASVALSHTAALLQVSLGEATPFTLVVRNTGSVPLNDIALHDLLADGARYSAGSARGSDSVLVAGRAVTFFVAGPLAPGASLTVRYAVAAVSATAPMLDMVAQVVTRELPVPSPPATASVRLGVVTPMQDRAVIGRLWVDENNNGRQDPGETGTGGIDIWSDDGAIATTDSLGRFSYTNIRPGRHGFRLDAASIPAGYRIATDGADRDMKTLDVSGWTTPSLSFRLVPSRGRVSSTRLPVVWSASARRIDAVIAMNAPNPGPNIPAAPRPTYIPTEYDVTFRNPYRTPITGLGVHFAATFDSIVVSAGDSVRRYSNRASLAVPPVGPDAQVFVRGWTSRGADSAPITLTLDGRVIDRAAVVSGVSLTATERVTAPAIAVDTLPDPGTMPNDGALEVVLTAPHSGWPGEASFPLPVGWEFAPNATDAAQSPVATRDRNGANVLLWRPMPAGSAPLTLRLRAVARGVAGQRPMIRALRTAAARDVDRKRAFLNGPGVAIVAPVDGTVFPSDRVYVGVQGESGAAATLFDGDAVVADVQLRIDGQFDFLAVPLAPGSHTLRIRMRNSWSQDRWDSVAVHVSGAPATFVIDQPAARPIELVADGVTTHGVHVRVLDKWGNPVANHPPVTITTAGAEAVNRDADPSSVGLQVLADDAGGLDIQLRPGKAVTRGTLTLAAANDVTQKFALDILPALQPLLLTAVGRIGLGAAPDAFGAMTVRGRLDRRTSLVASYDSRQLDVGRDAFGRTADPLEQSQYPILGDASAQRSYSASQYRMSARVERGFDWLALGDITTAGFGRDLTLSAYRRALPGVAARVTTGAVSWEAFGSSTSQVLQQRQLRGAGTSGPYQFNGGIRNGTEQVVLEVRAEENATRVISRQVLIRFVDYQIDYSTGTLLLKLPVPATDTYGNPVFIVVLSEADGGGPHSELWGLRTTLNAGRLARIPAMDSIRLGTTWVRESPGAGDHQLVGGDIHLARVGAVELNGEVSWSQSKDSSGFASSVSGGVTLFHGAGHLGATWLNIGREFGNPSAVALRGGTQELKLGGQFKAGTREFKVEHDWQSFEPQGITRQHTGSSIVQPFGSRLQLEASVAADRFDGGTAPEASQGGELKLRWKPDARWTLWTDTHHQFGSEGTISRPDFVGVGANFAVNKAVGIELRQRFAFVPGDSLHYSVTDLGLKSNLGAGTEAYGSYQIAGVEGGRNAALVGLRNHLRLGQSWSVNALFERRAGVDRASPTDPIRTLPFLQSEESYWSSALGAEYVQPKSPYRFSARAEWRDGDLRSSRLVTLVGDVSLNRSLAILSREEAMRTDQHGSTAATSTHRYSTLWGLAYRPLKSDGVNLLAKFEAIDASNANGAAVLTASNAESRTIAAAEAIWQPGRGVEVAGRYAMRRTSGAVADSAGDALPLVSAADFIGWRASFRLLPLLAVRADGRLLAERSSGTRRYDVAPQIVLLPQHLVEIATGYRFGDLRDPDFAVNGGPGWFVTFGARVTEQSFGSAAEFWRQRLGGRSQ